jgi:hypothetical protein
VVRDVDDDIERVGHVSPQSVIPIRVLRYISLIEGVQASLM